MINIEVWLGIVFIILIVLIVLKVVNKKQAAAVKLVIILFVFLMITAGYVSVKYDADLTTASGIKQAGKVYVSWVGAIFKNVGKVTTFAFQQDWSLNSVANKTISDVTETEEP